MNHEIDLHRTAAALERIGQISTATDRPGRSLYDQRNRLPADEPVTRVSAAITAVDPHHPVLTSPFLVPAIHLIQDHFAAVAASKDFCTRITWRDSDRTSGVMRVEHCASGMWLLADISGPITDRIVHGVLVNLDPGQSEPLHHACPPYPAHLDLPEWTAWTRSGCLGAPGDDVLGPDINRRYLGLGIGRRLYARGAAIVPTARWVENNTDDGGVEGQPSLDARGRAVALAERGLPSLRTRQRNELAGGGPRGSARRARADQRGSMPLMDKPAGSDTNNDDPDSPCGQSRSAETCVPFSRCNASATAPDTPVVARATSNGVAMIIILVFLVLCRISTVLRLQPSSWSELAIPAIAIGAFIDIAM